MSLNRLPLNRPQSYGETVEDTIRASRQVGRFQQAAGNDAVAYRHDAQRRLAKLLADLDAIDVVVEEEFKRRCAMYFRNVDLADSSVVAQALLADSLSLQASLYDDANARYRS